MSEEKYLEELRNDIDSIRLTVTDVHRTDYIKNAINIVMKYIGKLTPNDVAFAIKELFFIGSLDPAVLEGCPAFSIEGPARTLYILEDYVDNLQAIIDELRIIASDIIDEILIELDDYTDGLFDSFGI